MTAFVSSHPTMLLLASDAFTIGSRRLISTGSMSVIASYVLPIMM